ncbi:MAG: glycosyltransferase [Candidatus Doudnabacteria bacterium]|nr:glycosyltransferase [Candidatus Doudnabacteria bacterium]
MNILVVAPPIYPVPPYKGYGGSERGIYELCMGMCDLGHKIYLAAAGSSTISHPSLTLIGFKSETPWEKTVENKEFVDKRDMDKTELDRNSELHAKVMQEYDAFLMTRIKELISEGAVNVINFRHQSQAILDFITESPVPLVFSMHAAAFELDKRLYNSKCTVTVHTQSMKDLLPPEANVVVVPYGVTSDGVPFSEYTLSQLESGERLSLEVQKQIYAKGQDYALSLGTIGKHKGVRTAIEIAKGNNTPIVVAGTPTPRFAGDYENSVGYFKREIEPQIDNDSVYYFGNADEKTKYELMKYAKYFIFPAGYEDKRWKDTFGRVIAESLLTGTPVLVYADSGGSVEQVEHGRNGFIFNTVDEAIAYANDISRIDREYCREYAMENLSSKRFVEASEKLFSSLIAN